MRTGQRWMGVAMLAALATACSLGGKHRSSGPVRRTEIPVEVSNHNWSDMVVYAMHLGTRYRLGTVTSMSSRDLRIPPGVAGISDGVQLVADPIGSDQVYVTEPIVTGPDEGIVFSIENQLSISTYSVEEVSILRAHKKRDLQPQPPRDRL
ncbi:MAG TPA: hypothetical protein VFW98_13550 [Gemmatimonadaceae bacterium]|nr:hypothetical protein [Gemmatimonadaceae bacterium]